MDFNENELVTALHQQQDYINRQQVTINSLKFIAQFCIWAMFSVLAIGATVAIVSTKNVSPIEIRQPD
jgi:uncharacterized paraquat-inducible protein A